MTTDRDRPARASLAGTGRGHYDSVQFRRGRRWLLWTAAKRGSLSRNDASKSNRPSARIAYLAAIATALAAASCNHKPATPADKGRIVYMTTCVVCHNANPNLPGTQGPPIAGSSRELVEARVLHLSYPPGYKPKRNTHAMKAQPQLARQIDNITAFLQEAAPKQAQNPSTPPQHAADAPGLRPSSM